MNTGTSKLIDCDVHVYPCSADEIKAYLEQPWKHRFNIRRSIYYKNPSPPIDKMPPGGGAAGSDPDFLRSQLIDRLGIYRAIIMTQAHITANHDPDYSSAVATAYNSWLSDTWLGKYNNDGVFKGSIVINHRDPAAAAQEIDRWADHPHFVQIQMDTGASAPFGQRQYHPIYEAAERNGLPIAIHPGGESIGVNKPVWIGYPAHFTEYYTGFSFAMQSHLVSLLTEGTFERFPKLKVVIAEGGVTWLPALLWRLDQEWKGLRSEVPWITKAPSEYLRDHVRFTTQPLERPANDEDLLEVLDMMDAHNLLMFSSDYPESDFVSPDSSLPCLPAEWESRVLFENARQWYSL
jgi:predicted TIM-barrel fold metal-dependent hydrolase